MRHSMQLNKFYISLNFKLNKSLKLFNILFMLNINKKKFKYLYIN
uniref:Uncharacterized protein n=1 Tax=viral metagenome TaxID=1070528 RepID=A0A6C0E194_9ZZZZ